MAAKYFIILLDDCLIRVYQSFVSILQNSISYYA